MSGGANSNTFDSDIVVQNLEELAAVWVAPLDEGSEAWVVDEDARWVLRKDSGLVPDGNLIVQPSDGSPIAGAANARWIKEQEVACGLVQSLFVELAADQSTGSTVFVDIPGMSLNIVTSPLGGILLVDFSSSLGLFQPIEPLILLRADVRLVLDDVQISTSSFSVGSPITAMVNTVAMTKRVAGVAAGAHVLKAQWRVSGQGAVLGCTPTGELNSGIFYMGLRAIESMC